MPQGLLPDWLQALLMLVFIAAIVLVTLQQASELRRLQERAARSKKIIVEVACGESREKRGFSEGDYVGKRVPCPSGEEEGVIVAIYSEGGEEGKGRGVEKLSSKRGPAKPVAGL